MLNLGVEALEERERPRMQRASDHRMMFPDSISRPMSQLLYTYIVNKLMMILIERLRAPLPFFQVDTLQNSTCS